MTWAEFLIRQHAYKRMDKNSWYKVREIAYSALIGSHMDPKKLPKNKDLYMPLNEKITQEVTDVMRQNIKDAQERYKKEKNGK